jgi:hypothetical protein
VNRTAPAHYVFVALLFVLVVCAAFSQTASRAGRDPSPPSADFFVAVDGNDSWTGKLPAPNPARSDGPFASVARAKAAVASLVRSKPQNPVMVMLRQGTYFLALSPTEPGTLKFTEKDSGKVNIPILWTNYPGETPVLSGGVPVGKGGLALAWKKASGNLWQVQLPKSTAAFQYLFYNGERRLRARLQSAEGTGYYMRAGSCYSTETKQSVDRTQCRLGTYLRIASPISADDAEGENCPFATNQNGRRKCLDRFRYYDDDPITAFANLAPADSPWHRCRMHSSSPAPPGDVEVMIFNSWSVDVMRLSCVDTGKHILYFSDKTFFPSGGNVFANLGPNRNHRYIVENAQDAFRAAQTAGESGLWFLDRSTSPWVLNYLANPGEDPNQATVVIAQLGPADSQGGSLLSAFGLQNVTFRGLTFEVDNYVPPASGFNNDQNTEYTLPVAIDCESCQHVTFDGISVRHTSASGILISSASDNSGAPARDDTVQNSAFYDMGDCGIRIGHGATRADRWENVTQSITVENNLVQGYSRVFPDGEGIALSSGHDILFTHNDIGDGYHTGLAVCFFGCVGGQHDADGSNIVSSYNHIWDSMQGITSDGGTLYYNIGDTGGSGRGNRILNNLVHDTSDAGVIDGFPIGYGGRGIYLDNMSAGVDVENNVVYRMNQDVSWMSRGPAPGQPPNTFKNNIFAYGGRAIFHGAEWPMGCVEPSTRAILTSNIFYFDRDESQGFDVIQGCAYSCGLPYNQFLTFQGNLYWRTDGHFASDPQAFHVASQAPDNARRCPSRPADWTFLTFSDWQSSKQPVSWGPPGGMNEDTQGTATVDPGFGHTGMPADFLLKNNPVAGFDFRKTNDTIVHAGRVGPSLSIPAVPQTMPTYSFNEF